MPDREKTISGLEHCALAMVSGLNEDTVCKGCPYDGPGCLDRMMRDALALLRGEEASDSGS